MKVPQAFSEHVAMKHRLFSALFFDLPFDRVSQAGDILPLFARHITEGLPTGRDPRLLVEEFFHSALALKDFPELIQILFDILRLAERQVVLFDAVEEASFSRTRDMEGPGSLHDLLSRVEKAGRIPDLARLLDAFRVRIVLTAHPTQFYTEQVLGIIHLLRQAIAANQLDEINRLLLQLGRTRFKKRQKPSPWDEAKGVAWFMEHVLYHTVPLVQQHLMEGAGFSTEDIVFRSPLVELGFWPGGDRDGNPFVDCPTTTRVGRLLHDSLIRLYLADIDQLGKRLTFEGVQEILEAIRLRLEAALKVYDSLDPQAAWCSDMDTADQDYSPSSLLENLLALRRLITDHHGGLFVPDLDGFIHKVRCFGFHFASLDIRQDSRVLARALAPILALYQPDLPEYLALDQDARWDLLAALALAPLPSIAPPAFGQDEGVLQDCLDVLRLVPELQKRNGEAGLHRFIVSNTQGPGDILGLLILAKTIWAQDRVNLDLCPLFETVDDLAQAGKVMAKLWQNPAYQAHLWHRNRTQHIMLGFSDGTKDGGYLTANWSIYQAKQQLTLLAREQDIQLVFFDGRGGPPARGGGNTHKFYQSLGRDIESRMIHMTVQGQTISSMYGNHDTARYNLEQLLSAGLDNNLFPHTEQWHLNRQESQTMADLSETARRCYLSLRGHPDFMDYLQDISPLRYYGEANISSRPSKRPGSKKPGLEDLRAIPFVGAWSQLKQNIPGYYGLGTALNTLYAAGRGVELEHLYRDSLFFRTLLDNSAQSLCKVNLDLTAWVKGEAVHREFLELIRHEAQLTQAMLLRLSQTEELLQRDPIIQASIRMREAMILPIAAIQQWALQHLRHLDGKTGKAPGLAAGQEPQASDRTALEKMVIKSMAICVNASRNSV